jgi:hypothetical protein
MREPLSADKLRAFLRELGKRAKADGRVYLTGGATAVLLGWRSTTVDIDMKLVPDQDALLRALPELKESLRVNVELAAPSDFIPELPGWVDRSLFVSREGSLSVFHYDPYSQALSKIERGHRQDAADVSSLGAAGLIDPVRLEELFARIEPQLYRFPAIDPAAFRAAVANAVAALTGSPKPPGR